MVFTVKGFVFCDSSNINYLAVILGMFVWLPSDIRFGRFYQSSFLVIIFVVCHDKRLTGTKGFLSLGSIKIKPIEVIQFKNYSVLLLLSANLISVRNIVEFEGRKADLCLEK